MYFADPDEPRFSVMPLKSHSFLVKWQAFDPVNYSMPGTTFHLKYTLVGKFLYNVTFIITLNIFKELISGTQPTK